MQAPQTESHPQATRCLSLFRGYHHPMDLYYANSESGGFTLLSLDLTSRCNYDCDWCCNKTVVNREEPDLLTFEERTRLLEQASTLGARTLVAVGVGEPTLDRDFYPLVEKAASLGMTTVLYSNVTGCMDRDRIHFLRDHDASIAIKLDSFDMRHFLARNHTTMGGYYKFLRNFMHIMEAYRGTRTRELRDGTPVDIHHVIGNMVLNLENYAELGPMADLCAEFEVPLFIRPIRPTNWAEADMDTWKKLGNPTGQLVPADELVEAARTHNTLFAPSATLENHCAIYSFGLVLRNNGDVLLCPDNEKTRGKFGNVRTRSMEEIAGHLRRSKVIKSGYCDMLPTIDHTNAVEKEMAHIRGASARYVAVTTSLAPSGVS